MSITLHSIQPTLHELKLGLKELYGDRLVRLILFGSHARGEANTDSDIDLLIVLKSNISQFQETMAKPLLFAIFAPHFNTVVVLRYVKILK